MTTNVPRDPLHDISQIESSLWEAADQLRANSKLTSSEYCMPVLGVIFLRHATNRYQAALKAIQADQATGKSPKRPLVKGDFIKRRALMLPEVARYDHLLKLPSGANLGAALVDAMDAIEADFEPLAGQLPRDYDRFENKLLEDLLRNFDSQALRNATGDVFGRIYEYFLIKFAMQGAQDNGEFFTPPSLVQTIVNVIEPDHGVVADLACGSGGMFVQSSHFIEHEGQDTMKRVTFYGQEKTATTIRLAKMNLAVHGLEGDIREANSFYDDVHRLQDGRALWGNCDFVMANPPFNVDMVDAERVKDDRRMTLLEDSARLLYREWFVRLRFPGYEHTRIVDGVPLGWERKALESVCSSGDGIQTGPFGSQLHQSDYSDEGVPVVMPKDIIDFRVSVTSIARIPESLADSLGRHRMVAGDTVYGRRGDIGRRAYITKRQAGWFCGTGCLRIRPDPIAISPRFLFAALGTPGTVGDIANRAKGSTMLNLSTAALKPVQVLVPSRTLQDVFVENVEIAHEMVKILVEPNQKLRAARDLLLPRLMSGEIAV